MPIAPHVLLIEDDTSLAANLCDVLKEDGFKVTICNRGDEGLRRASNDECDVVLTELRLPGLGGLELVRQLHETQPRLPVVLMTAHGTTFGVVLPREINDIAKSANYSARIQGGGD